MACDSIPPPNRVSNEGDPVLSFPTFFLRSKTTSPVSNPSIRADCLAALIILAAVASPTSAIDANSIGDVTATDSIELNPASLNFSAVAGPIPGNSSNVMLSSLMALLLTASNIKLFISYPLLFYH